MTAALALLGLGVAAAVVYGSRRMRHEVARLDEENRRLRTELAVLRAAHRARGAPEETTA